MQKTTEGTTAVTRLVGEQVEVAGVDKLSNRRLAVAAAKRKLHTIIKQYYVNVNFFDSEQDRGFESERL